jgi:hypothetical protein
MRGLRLIVWLLSKRDCSLPMCWWRLQPIEHRHHDHIAPVNQR